MASLLIRRARLVPVARNDEVPADPVDVFVERGLVTVTRAGVARPSAVEEVDAGGRWLIPGLWDQHVHLGQQTLAAQRLDLGSVRSPADALRLVAERLAEQPGQPVIGWGHRSARWERDGTTAELDLLSWDTPVVLISGDGHHGWLNTVAMSRLEIPLRDGVVREAEWFAAYPRLETIVGREGTSPRAYRRTLDAAAARGIVGLVDFEFGEGPLEWTQRWHQGCDRLRIRTAAYADSLDEVIKRGLRTGDALPGCDERVTMGPLKIISDGSINTRTAWCHEPYLGSRRLSEPLGQPSLPADDLVALLVRAGRAGLEVATHAIGDAAVTAALAAYAETGARGSIEHVQLVRREDVRQLAALGVRASVQPAHLLDDRELTDELWGERSARCFALRWMIDDGVTVAFGSDAPVSPLDPWLSMATAVHRGAEQAAAWHPEQAVTVQEALAASVDGQPTVRVGSRGDLVLLDADPLPGGTPVEVSSALRRQPPVAATIVAGEVVHSTL